MYKSVINQKLIFMSMSLARFQIAPITRLVSKLSNGISEQEVKASFGGIMIDTEMGSTLINLGKKFMNEDFNPLGIVSQLNNTYSLDSSRLNKNCILNFIKYNCEKYFKVWLLDI